MLIEMLKWAEDDLYVVVFKKKHFLHADFQSLFPGPWKDIQGRLQQARHMVQHNNVRWKYVEGVGLTGESLKFKHGVYAQARTHGLLSRIFKVINSFLGSLSGGIPILEPVKEYKENLEAAMEGQ
jgi:hypothetical protein